MDCTSGGCQADPARAPRQGAHKDAGLYVAQRHGQVQWQEPVCSLCSLGYVFGLCSTVLQTVNNFFFFFFPLAKCHDDEICAGCTKTASTSLYESGLLCKLDDAPLELFARMRLIETYYKTHNAAITKQLDTAEPLLEAITDLQERNAKSADLYYYRGILHTHKTWTKIADQHIRLCLF